MKQNYTIGSWQVVKYRHEKIPGFAEWSGLVEVDRDSRLKGLETKADYQGILAWLKRILTWKKCAIIRIVAKPGTKFRVGVYANSHVCKISPVVCEVCVHKDDHKFEYPGGAALKQGQIASYFAERVGPESNHFFVIADGPIEVYFYSYIYEDSKLDNERYHHVKLFT